MYGAVRGVELMATIKDQGSAYRSNAEAAKLHVIRLGKTHFFNDALWELLDVNPQFGKS